MRRFSIVVISIVMMIGASSGVSYADRRSYVWTYEYVTMPKGTWEVEAYLTAKVPDTNRSNLNTLKPQLELEYGVTDRWDLALYQMWKFSNKRRENDSEYEGFKLRTRYRLGEKGKWPVDPLLYFEYIRDDDFSRPNSAEAKLVLAKDIGSVNLSYNQVIKRTLAREGAPSHEYAIGAAYALSPRARAGIESKGSYSQKEYAIGPTFSFAWKRIWTACGVVFGLNEDAGDLEARVIIGMPF